MANPTNPPIPTVAEVDAMVDENGSRITVPAASPIRVSGEHEELIEATSPINWWMYGLIALGIVVAILLTLQLFNGAPGTAVQPGSPTAAPVTSTIPAP